MTDAHEQAPDEDPEQHIGEPVPDPWDVDERPVSLEDYDITGWT